MKKKALFLILTFLISISLFGCGSKLPQVQLSVWGSEQEQELLNQMVDSFKEEYKGQADFQITVCEESVGTCQDTVSLCPEVAADVYFIADDQLRLLVEDNALATVEDTALESVMESVGGPNSVAVAAASLHGTMYAYPCTASNGYFLYYNKNYLSEDDVKDLDTILDVASKNGKKFGMEMTSGWYLYSFFTAAGLDAHISEDNSTNICDWADETKPISGADVVDKLFEITSKDSFVSVNNDDFIKGIKSGDIIAGISGTWNSTEVEAAFKDGYGACKLPCYNIKGESLQMHSVAGYKLVGVNPYSNNIDWAHKLAQWFTNEDNQLIRFQQIGEGPANRKVAASDEVKSSIAIAALADQIQYGHLQYVEGSYWDATFKLGNIIVAGNPEGKTSQQLVEDAQNAMTK